VIRRRGDELPRAAGCTVAERRFLTRLVLYVAASRIERVLYPVAAPSESAEAMLALLGAGAAPHE
jgi:hypothetical protein